MCVSLGGALWGFGRNHYGQLGLPAVEEVAEPTLVDIQFPAVSHYVVEVAGGDGHTLLLDNTGGVYAMGSGRHGNLGSINMPFLHTCCLLQAVDKTAHLQSVAFGRPREHRFQQHGCFCGG